MSDRVERAELLLSRGRADLAEKEARGALAEDPDDALAHAVLALCLGDLKKFKEGLREARRAVELMPDNPATHYVLSRTFILDDQYGKALTAIEEALRLEPEDAAYHAVLAAIKHDEEKWKESLAATEVGLRLDPENAECANIRASALQRLGRVEEAGAVLDAALSREPENAFTHANKGQNLLREGDAAGALEAYREALRLDPNDEQARAGVVEALKARSLFYRLTLRYFFWFSSFERETQFAFVAGLWPGARALKVAAKHYPAVEPFALPLLVLYGAIMFASWLGRPISNLLLRFSRYGRLTLTDEEIEASDRVGALLAAAAILGSIAWIQADWRFGFVGFLFMVLAFPVSAYYAASEGAPRKKMRRVVLVVVPSGFIGVFLIAVEIIPQLGAILAAVAILGSVWSTVLSRRYEDEAQKERFKR